MRTIARLVSAGSAFVLATALFGSGPAHAASTNVTLSSTTGPSGGANPITATAGAAVFIAGSQPTVQFQYYGNGATTCTAMAKTVTQITANTANATTAGVLTVDPTAVKQFSTTKVAFAVPSSPYPTTDVNGDTSTVNPTGLSLLTGQTSSKWNVCFYDSDSTTASTLLATSVYTLYPRPKITKVIPASSPSSGGQSITVVGSGFSTTSNSTTASIGGAALTAVKVAANGNSFTATTSAHAPATGLTLIVSTLGGMVTGDDPDNNGLPQDDDPTTPDAPIPFTYSNGIVITPNTAPAGTKVDIDVKGVGFSSLVFTKGSGGSTTDAKSHVFLVRDAYNPSSNRGVAECTGVLVISNYELACTLDLTAPRLDPSSSAPVGDSTQTVTEGTYTLTVVANASQSVDTPTANASIVSTGSTFTVGPY